MENAPVLAWITDGNGILYYMNTRFKNSFNYSDDHLNKKIGSIAPITEREKALLPHKDILTKNKSVEFFHEWIDENKKVHYYRTYQFPIKDVEGNCLAGGQSIEITAELLAQRALEKSNELFEYVGKSYLIGRLRSLVPVADCHAQRLRELHRREDRGGSLFDPHRRRNHMEWPLGHRDRQLDPI